MEVHQLTRALEYVTKEVTGEATLITLLTFLLVAQRGTCFQKAIELELEITAAAASRNVSYWTKRRSDGNPGVGFVERIADPYNRRFRKVSLTRRGRKFYNELKDEDLSVTAGAGGGMFGPDSESGKAALSRMGDHCACA